MERVFVTVVNMSIAASWVIAAILLARLIVGRAPKKHSYALWAAAGFRLCCPVSFKLPVSIFNIPEAGANGVSASGTACSVAEGISGIAEGITYDGQAAGQLTDAGVMNSASVMALIWLMVALIFIAFSIVSYIRLKQRMNSALRLEGCSSAG